MSVINKARVRIPYVLQSLFTRSTSTLEAKRTNAKPYIVQPRVRMDTIGGNLAAYVLKNAHRWPNKVAVECAVTKRKYTYSQMVDRIARFGGVLKRMGIGRGDIVAIMMVNCPEYPLVLFGALTIGATATLLNSQYTKEEVSRQLKDSKAKIVVADEVTWGTVSNALDLLEKPSLPTILNFPSSSPTPSGHPNLQRLVEDKNIDFADIIEVNDRDVCIMPYSSGTTGNPKGVSLSHSAFVNGVAAFMHPTWFSVKETTDCYQETYLSYLPLFHAYGLLPFLGVGFRNGFKILTIPKFDPNTFVSHVRQHKVRNLYLVPSVLNYMMKSPEVIPENMAALENVMCSAAPISKSAVQTFTQKIGKEIQFQEAYGMTEVLVSHCTPLGSDRIGSTGINIPNVEAKVLDIETGNLLGPNQTGEICIKSPTVMNGYFSNDKATQEILSEDGWLRTGDVGYFDEEEYFCIVDRTKELIKVNALQVSPSELEGILLQHPKVSEVGVIGVPDEKRGEVPRAYVVTKEPATEAEISEFLAGKVAKHKRLAGGVFFIDEIPKNQTGKLLRRQLKLMSKSE